MTQLVAGGILGMLMGIGLQRCGLTDRCSLRRAMALHRRNPVRRMLMLTGLSTLLTAFLAWLAVIDVDKLQVLPLHAGTLLGGVIFGAAAGAIGALPGTLPGGIGGGRCLESLCGTVGCVLGALLLPHLQPWFSRIQSLATLSADTLFQVTLDQPYLFAGGFLGQGCIGILLMIVAWVIPADPVDAAPQEPSPPPAEPVSTDAQDVQADTVIVQLPGEEVLVVDTAAPEGAPPDETGQDDADEPPAPPDADTPQEDTDAAPTEDDTSDSSTKQDGMDEAPDTDTPQEDANAVPTESDAEEPPASSAPPQEPVPPPDNSEHMG